MSGLFTVLQCPATFVTISLQRISLFLLRAFRLRKIYESNFNEVTPVHSPVVPAKFKGQLKNQQVTEDGKVLLSCVLSKPGCQVQWKKGAEILKSGGRFQITEKDTVFELQILNLVVEDTGEYVCECGNERTAATVVVNGRDKSLLFNIHIDSLIVDRNSYFILVLILWVR